MNEATRVTLEDHHGLPAWIVRTPHARAAISVQGGQLLSWQPHGSDEVLWLSPNTRQPPSPIRGGVPICWPYFGRQDQPADVPQHGFARLRAWRWVDMAQADDGDVVIDLVLPEDAATPLRLRQRLRVGRQLSQALITHNTGTHALTLTQALHSYFAVTDAARTQLFGVDGLRYEDKLGGGEQVQQGPWRLDEPRDPGRSDRIYATRGGAFVLRDEASGRALTLDTEGSASLVVWNPGAEGSTSIGDLPAEGWRGFVCVEVANAGADRVHLAPGAEHRLVQHLRLDPSPPRID